MSVDPAGSGCGSVRVVDPAGSGRGSVRAVDRAGGAGRGSVRGVDRAGGAGYQQVVQPSFVGGKVLCDPLGLWVVLVVVDLEEPLLN